MTAPRGDRGPDHVAEAALEDLPAAVPPIRRLLRVLHMGTVAVTRSWFADPGVEPASAQAGAAARRDRFDEFYRVNYAAVVRLAYSLCGSRSVAEELAQEAFVAAHRRWRRIVRFDRPDLWVRRVVINRSISHRRRADAERRALQRIQGRREELSQIEPSDEEIWVALRSLSPRQAQILALVYVEDQPIAEVAAILGLGEETVRTHLKRGRAALAARLSADVEQVEP